METTVIIKVFKSPATRSVFVSFPLLFFFFGSMMFPFEQLVSKLPAALAEVF